MTLNTESKMLSQNPDWTFSDIQEYAQEIEKIAVEELGLTYYPNQIEIITSEQMLDAYASNGLPVTYKHWTFGKKFLQNYQQYHKGETNLAYEIVINSNPCIAYLMEGNSLMMQALVIAHASFGHNAFFKNNYLFKERTQADAIIDHMVYAQEYVTRCEEKYGLDVVEQFIDSVHSLRYQGFHHFKRPSALSKAEMEQRRKQQDEEEQRSHHPLWDKIIPKKKKTSSDKDPFRLPAHPTENVLEFIEQYAPNMLPWQRNIIEIIRYIQEYYVPQMQTQVANEGFATFVHHYIMHRLHEKGIIDQGFIQEFMISHTNVITQRDYNNRYGGGSINPYALGFAIYTDIKRICTNPTEEDREWFPNLVDTDWIQAIKTAAYESRDETFILQYLSPTVMRHFKMFSTVQDLDNNPYAEVTGVCNNNGYKTIREMLARQYNVFEKLPSIEVVHVNTRGDRRLTLHFKPKYRTLLDTDSIVETLVHIQKLWGFDVCLKCFEPAQPTLNETEPTRIAECFLVDHEGEVEHYDGDLDDDCDEMSEESSD